MTDIFSLGLKADTSDIDKGAKSLDNIADSAEKADKKAGQLRDGINTLGKAVTTFGVSAAAALTTVTVQAANSAREIENLARLTGQSVAEFQRTTFAAQAYGIEQEKLADILKDTSDKVGDFLATGAGGMADFFENVAPKVGITADNFRDLNGADALQLYISSLEKANVSQNEMVFYLEAIASDATLLQPLLANNGAELERLADRAETLGLVLDDVDLNNLTDLDQSLRELRATSEATSNLIGATFAPFVKDLTDKFNDNAIAGETVRETLHDMIEVGGAVVGVFADAGRVFEIFGKALGATAFTVVENFNTMDTRLEQMGVGFELTLEEMQLELVEWVNSQDAELVRWANSIIESVNVFGLLDDIKLEVDPLDTSALTTSIAALTEQAEQLEADLVGSNQAIADAWQDVVDLIMKPLPSDGIDAWIESIREAVKAQRELQAVTEETGKGQATSLDAAASSAVTFLEDIKEVSKGVTAAFGENETAAERLHQVNLAIAIAEQAMILQKVVADSAATQTHLANSAARTSANATEAVTAAATAPFPVGFAAAAAMIGLMTSLVGTFGGGSSGSSFGGPSASELAQEEQGTGTILGDVAAKADSLIESQERFEGIAVDQLAELREIRDSNAVIARSIGGVSAAVAAGGIGEFQGSLADTIDFSTSGGIETTTRVIRQRIVDEGLIFAAQSLRDIIENGFTDAQAFFDVSARTVTMTDGRVSSIRSERDTRTELQEVDALLSSQLGDIFSNIGSVISESADVLGLDVQSALDDFVFDVGRISLKDLTGEEIQEEIAAVFSAQADLAAEAVLPGLARFQEVGEGLFDTLTRVAQEQVIFTDALERMGTDLSNLSSIMQIEIAQGLLAVVGGAERFNELTSDFFNDFFTEAEQFDHLTQSLTEAMESLGHAVPDTREGFRDLVEGVDVTTEAGQRLFASLLELAPAMDEYFDVLEDRAAEELAAAAEAAAAAEREAAAQARAEEQAAAEAAREAAQDAAAAERALAEARREAEAATAALERTASSAFGELTQAIRTEQQALQQALSEDLGTIEAEFDARRDSIAARMNDQISSMERQLSTVEGQASALESLSGTLSDSISTVFKTGRAEAEATIQGAIDAAQGGQSIAGMDLRGAVSAFANIDEAAFGSRLDLQRERGRTANQLTELKDLTDGQLSVAERNAQLLEGQIATIRRSSEAEIEALNMAQAEAEAAAQGRFDEESEAFDAMLETARSQLDALLGIDSSVKSLEEAQTAFTAAIQALAADAADVAVADMQASIAQPQFFNTPFGIVPNPAASDAPSDAGGPTASETHAAIMAIASNTATTASLARRWDGDGLPETRDAS